MIPPLLINNDFISNLRQKLIILTDFLAINVQKLPQIAPFHPLSTLQQMK